MKTAEYKNENINNAFHRKVIGINRAKITKI